MKFSHDPRLHALTQINLHDVCAACADGFRCRDNFLVVELVALTLIRSHVAAATILGIGSRLAALIGR
jgi:hypothetical protein